MFRSSFSEPCRKKRTQRAKDVDRLSDLPDSILRHTLSFLDSKSAVQTSSLSRRWRSVWKGVPTLNFDSRLCFKTHQDFRRFVSKFLSCRYDATKVRAMCLELAHGRRTHFREQDALLSKKLLDYATSHGIQHLQMNSDESARLFTSDRETISDLETLDLENVCLDKVSFVRSPAFKLVTNLCLVSCRRSRYRHLSGSGDRNGSTHLQWDDPFANFPNLKNLTLKDCHWTAPLPCLRVSGHKLLHLRIEGLRATKIEIFATNLTTLYYKGDLGSPELFELYLPSLDRAYIDHQRLPSGTDEQLKLINWFDGLCFARTLELTFYTMKVLERSLNSQMLSPFTRLETLIFDMEDAGKSFDVPYSITRYFLGNPSNNEAKSAKFKVSSSPQETKVQLRNFVDDDDYDDVVDDDDAVFEDDDADV